MRSINISKKHIQLTQERTKQLLDTYVKPYNKDIKFTCYMAGTGSIYIKLFYYNAIRAVRFSDHTTRATLDYHKINKMTINKFVSILNSNIKKLKSKYIARTLESAF